jgi:diguanylate cyclase (GGDEF)-like protein
MKSMKIKLLVRLAVLFLLLFVSVLLTVAVTVRRQNMEAAKERGMSIADLTRDAITSLMAINAADKQDIFLRGMTDTYGVADIHVIRGAGVVKQYGLPKSGRTITPMELEVLRTGEKRDSLQETFSRVTYFLVIPYKAETRDNIDCLSCHADKSGSVLGAISISMDLTKDRFSGMGALLAIGGISVVFFVLGFLTVIRFFNPYILTAKRLKSALEHAKDGHFNDRVAVVTDDEMGDVTTGFNIMADKLNSTLSEVDRKVSILIGHGAVKTGNALHDTAKIVDELAKIYNFKRVIEKDRGKAEIYSRIEAVLGDYLGLDKFSVYEVNHQENKMIKIAVAGREYWCSEVLGENADECRAKRTGHDVDFQDFPCVCPNFALCDPGVAGDFICYCLPVYVGGGVGIVVQIVFEKEDFHRVKTLIPYIKGYLQEASPVLESKTFMEILKEQSLIDQLTGLHNRRFLEEIGVGLSSQVKRRGTLLGVLMVDVDHFKEVNDSHGHDVGDKVLQELSASIRNAVREADIVIRFGGEEILVLLVDTENDNSMVVAEKLRQSMEQKVVELPGVRLKKTVSVGVAEFPVDSDKLWQVIKYADVAMFKAKERGRNKVVRFEKEMWQDTGY